MDNLDTQSLCEHLYNLGLVNEEMITDALAEAGPNPEVEDFLRVMQRKQYLTQWQTGKVMRGDVDGFFLGGYRLLYKIASGTFGRVYRADEPATAQMVAIKVLRQRWTEKKGVIDLFFREARMGMTLKHPNIVEILNVGQDPGSGHYYIVMEFVEGDNLREILKIQGKFEVARALAVLEETASGLAYAFAQGVTHRDMKLTNILMSSDKTAKLVDFGLAQIYTSMGGVEIDKVDRTVDYAGLEKATGVKRGDVRSDIYFLGCVLYQLLTGHSPLAMTRSARARMEKHRFDDVKPMSPLEVDAPASVFLLVETMMSLDADRRYQTPSQLLDAVKAARRDVEGKSAGPSFTGANRSLFVVESDERLQDVFREKFKEYGYRVLIAADPGGQRIAFANSRSTP